MYAIDLFCGAGGFSEGIIQSGFHIVFSSDRSPYVKQTYENRHEQLGLIHGKNTFFELADIRDLKGDYILEKVNDLGYFKDLKKNFRPGDIDAVFGGPPCQGFSIAGKRDKSDPRNMLFREYLRVINEIKPKYIVMENVTGFMSMQVNPDFESFNNITYPDDELVNVVVQKELKGFGYEVLDPQILDASDYGVPQKRQRAIVLAYRKDVPPINYPSPTTSQVQDKKTVKDALVGISIKGKSEFDHNSSIGRTPHFVTKKPISHINKNHMNIDESKHSGVIVERFSLFNQGESVANLKTRLTNLMLNGEEIVNLENHPNLILETLFNINKDFNLVVLKQSLTKQLLEFKSSQITSIYTRIMKVWDYDVTSVIFIQEAKKPFSSFKLDASIFTSIFNECKIHFHGYINHDLLNQWFKGENLNIIDLNGVQNLEISNEEYISLNTLFNALLTNKNTRTRLHLNNPSPTMLTIPDDFIHPTLNKVLNVREMARLQSFDDSFEFLGKRTTGGEKRVQEVPQFTQVGNAVPPLLAYAIAVEVGKGVTLNNQ